MRLKRDVLFGFTDMLGTYSFLYRYLHEIMGSSSVYIGGIAGLFLGCSVLSFIEIVYYFTMRLFWFVVDLKRRPKIIMDSNGKF